MRSGGTWGPSLGSVTSSDVRDEDGENWRIPHTRLLDETLLGVVGKDPSADATGSQANLVY